MITIRIVLDNGTVFKYDVKDLVSMREHLHKIMVNGFRSDNADGFRCYPIHRISHIDSIIPDGLKDELMVKYPSQT